jgi:murein DD-endopeptidase MepM/ murein hydrolase activator NlpD|tara:strand:+ start:1306 stop:2649 length:1344 start_codon:yes stop_codon:yes gene_type:complete
MHYQTRSYPRFNLIVALLSVAAFLTLLAVMPTDTAEERIQKPVSLSIPTLPAAVAIEGSINVPGPVMEPVSETTPSKSWKEVRIRRGDSLSNIFNRLGLSPADLHEVMRSGTEVRGLANIIPGRRVMLDITGDGELNGLRYDQTPFESLIVARIGSRFRAERRTYEPDVVTTIRSASITREHSSLYKSGEAVGLSANILMELSYIFQWDISFALDLRTGDEYSLLYEENYLDGKKVNDGKILAASFTNLGTTHVAVLYTSTEGDRSYYTPDGQSMRKAFIRDPIHFSRVSSSFNPRRLHPIHKRVMPHRGIDYVARSGTPVMASGDGKVKIARQNAASGKYVVIQHGEQYTTKYLHLSKYARNVRPGKRVKQGQTIGYVGATGWATAPHLHYEFLLNGVHRNPRTVKLPMVEPIPSVVKERFVTQVTPYLDLLNESKRSNQIASSGE